MAWHKEVPMPELAKPWYQRTRLFGEPKSAITVKTHPRYGV